MTTPAQVRSLIADGDLEGARRSLDAFLASGADWTSEDMRLITRYAQAVNGGARFHQMPVAEQSTPPAAEVSPLLPAERESVDGIRVLGEPPTAIRRLSNDRVVTRPAIDLWTIPAATVCYVRGAFVVKDRADVTIAACSGRGGSPLEDIYQTVLQHKKVRHVAGRAILLCDPSDGNNYCHWTLDHLTRLALYERADSTPATLLLSSRERSFVGESLSRALGRHADVVALTEHPLVKVDELHVVTSAGSANQHPAHRGAQWALEYLRDRLIPPRTSRTPARVYVSRNDAAGRRVTNEVALLAALEKHGFEAVTLAGVPVTEQASIFAGAEMIIAPHGAGLSNLAFSSPPVRVLELIPSSYATPAFAMIAQARGLDYTAMACEAVPSQPSRPSRDDLLVDVEAVQRWLRSQDPGGGS